MPLYKIKLIMGYKMNYKNSFLCPYRSEGVPYLIMGTQIQWSYVEPLSCSVNFAIICNTSHRGVSRNLTQYSGYH